MTWIHGVHAAFAIAIIFCCVRIISLNTRVKRLEQQEKDGES